MKSGKSHPKQPISPGMCYFQAQLATVVYEYPESKLMKNNYVLKSFIYLHFREDKFIIWMIISAMEG